MNKGISIGVMVISLGILAENVGKQCGHEVFVGNAKCWSILLFVD